MFHRQRESDGNMPPSPQEKARDKAPVELYVKNEKEPQMYQNQTNASQSDDAKEADSAAPTRPIDIPGNPAGLQRPMQPPRMPGAFPGSYASAPGAGGNTYAMGGKSAEGRRLVVGEGISLSGEIEACDVLIVEGTIEAALKGAKVLEIAESGVFYGAVEIEEATVAGRFEGDLTVNGRLTIRSTGSITGEIAYKELAVEAGATLEGKVTPLSAGGQSAKKPDSRPAQAKKAPMRNDASVNELPFSDKAAVSA